MYFQDNVIEKKTKNKATNEQINALREFMKNKPKMQEADWALLKSKLDMPGKERSIQQWKNTWKSQEKYVFSTLISQQDVLSSNVSCIPGSNMLLPLPITTPEVIKPSQTIGVSVGNKTLKLCPLKLSSLPLHLQQAFAISNNYKLSTSAQQRTTTVGKTSTVTSTSIVDTNSTFQRQNNILHDISFANSSTNVIQSTDSAIKMSTGIASMIPSTVPSKTTVCTDAAGQMAQQTSSTSIKQENINKFWNSPPMPDFSNFRPTQNINKKEIDSEGSEDEVRLVGFSLNQPKKVATKSCSEKENEKSSPLQKKRRIYKRSMQDCSDLALDTMAEHNKILMDLKQSIDLLNKNIMTLKDEDSLYRGQLLSVVQQISDDLKKILNRT